jgi:hypothetical protein
VSFTIHFFTRADKKIIVMTEFNLIDYKNRKFYCFQGISCLRKTKNEEKRIKAAKIRNQKFSQKVVICPKIDYTTSRRPASCNAFRL